MVGEILKIQLLFFLSLFELSGGHRYSTEDNRLNAYIINEKTNFIFLNESLVNRFYDLNSHQLYWFSLEKESALRRQSLLNFLDTCQFIGLEKGRYHYQEVVGNINAKFLPGDSTQAMIIDRIFTDAALMSGMDIYCGKDIPHWISSDEISRKYIRQDETYVINQILRLAKQGDLIDFIASMEPENVDYGLLKSSLINYIDSNDSFRIAQLSSSIDQFRWIHHFNFNKFIVVNIPSASLSYYESDSVKLRMKVVVGKPSTRTPRISAYCDQIILFPYWNVPHKIAVNEYLPIFKKMPSMVSIMNMRILDKNGKIIPEDKINWSLYSKTNFPLRIQQSTGCDNALGIIKFNLTSPYDVYMHDTNLKSAFKSDYRFYSHGCIRLEKPFELANYLLSKSLDPDSLSNLKMQNPKNMSLVESVPVFVVYMTAEVIEGQLKFYHDIYKLLK